MRPLNYTKRFTADGNSDVIDLRQVFCISMHSVSGAATTGNLKIQVSNESPDNPAKIVNWVDLPSATIAVTAGSSQLLQKIETSYAWARVVLASLAGTNGITIYVKGLGQ